MKRFNIILLFLIFVFALFTIYFFTKSKPQKQPEITLTSGTELIAVYGKTISEEEIEAEGKNQNWNKLQICDCLPEGKKIVLWNIDQNQVLEGTEGEVKPQPPKPTGIGESYALNYPLDPGSETENKVSSLLALTNTSPKVNEAIRIAVLDTGIDPKYLAGSIIDTTTLCGRYKNYKDDHDGRHGTTVTQLLLEQFKNRNYVLGQTRNQSQGFPQIIPIKILDSQKQGTLFDLICGLYAAKAAGATAVNASLGYYGEPVKALEEAILAIGIPVFTGAGNAKASADGDREAPRNLTTRIPKFYPACYNTTCNNLFVISSATQNSSAPNNFINCSNQNYSNIFVDFYVETNGMDNFKNDFIFNQNNISGSSFATPIFAGQYLKNGYAIPRALFTQPEAIGPIANQKILKKADYYLSQ
jgi:hypothetical protein